MKRFVRPQRSLSAFTTLFFLNFLVLVHGFSIVYVNSSFLGTFFSPGGVSAVYIVAPLAVMGALAVAPTIMSFVGVWRLFILIAPTLQAAVFFLGFSKDPVSAAFFFIIQAILIYLLRYLLDIYLESISKDESKTGNTRGLFITAGNIGVFLGPLIASVVIVGNQFAPLYAASALMLTPAFFVALGPLRLIKPHIPKRKHFIETLKGIWCCRVDLRRVMGVHFLMQLFNGAIVLYGPLFLFDVGGLSWQAIGTLTALALLPYLILEIPLGFLADRFWGEKELMATGLVVLSLSLILMSVTPVASLFLWGAWFVATRIGGALTEIATESYFFKQVTEGDASLISSFRMLAPLGGVAAPIIGLVALAFFNFSSIFAVFGCIILSGLPLALALNDTR